MYMTFSLCRSRSYTLDRCKEIRGFFSQRDNFCYYDKVCGSGHLTNGKCYSFVDSSYTATTCSNIGGYFATSNTYGHSGQLCYYDKFSCKFYIANGQCYRFQSSLDNEKDCNNIDGYFKHGYCYYECPSSRFLVNGECYFNRSTQYTESDCEAVGGVFDHSYCYLKGCNFTMINNKCYKSRSSEYSKGTCINIGGSYAAEPDYPNRRYCFYTNDHCRLHAVNKQCYSRSSNHSQTACKTIPHSYYDDSSRTCYYYCTEMPELGQCFVGSNSSFTRDMCSLIGGVTVSDTCYYVSLSCPAYNTSDGLCYSNRNVSLTCDTCRNIGGYHEDGFCHYYQNNCGGYRLEGQCYSSRTPTSEFSLASCRNMGGNVRNGFCFYDAIKSSGCRYYRNCECYLRSSSFKTSGTCSNIGGHYDAVEQRCLYNSSACPYYAKNSQCYTRKTSNFSRETCSVIDGYFERYSCYYFNLTCRYTVNGQCYLMVSWLYHEGTCASIGGYYSRNEYACYYNYFSCSYSVGGQCYDTHIPGWSEKECDVANGHYEFNGVFYTCYISRLYCRYIFNSSCFRYVSTSLDCSSCRLLEGHFQFGSCYFRRNCSQPLFFAEDGQCYKNQTAATAAECSAIIGSSFYDQTAGKCYFTSGHCSSGHYANCKCFVHSSTIYTAGSCKNFGGECVNGVCYYNSSYCRYYSVNGQCYLRYRTYNLPDMCLNIGGYYVYSTRGSNSSGTTTLRPRHHTTTSPLLFVGLCYYNSFNCSGFVVDRHYCYSNRSSTFNAATCRNIGGRYAYRVTDSTYSTVRRYFYSLLFQTTYYCLYNTFSCRGYVYEFGIPLVGYAA